MIKAFIKVEGTIYVDIVKFVSEESLLRWANKNNKEVLHYEEVA